ncbi:MAG TPA: response regulator [Stellaceae bacterium]|jgi:CheY-like chemotaxis protein|nr:response regulator [Stellaceae bacterium]
MADTSKPPTILIVEDEALVAALVTDMLEEMGFEVTGVAGSGREALALVAEIRPRLALIDIRLAGPVDGIELACQLRAEYGVPAIFLSGAFDPDTALRAQSAHPLGVMQKPFRPSEVFNAIERALAMIDG